MKLLLPLFVFANIFFTFNVFAQEDASLFKVTLINQIPSWLGDLNQSMAKRNGDRRFFENVSIKAGNALVGEQQIYNSQTKSTKIDPESLRNSVHFQFSSNVLEKALGLPQGYELRMFVANTDLKNISLTTASKKTTMSFPIKVCDIECSPMSVQVEFREVENMNIPCGIMFNLPKGTDGISLNYSINSCSN